MDNALKLNIAYSSLAKAKSKWLAGSILEAMRLLEVEEALGIFYHGDELVLSSQKIAKLENKLEAKLATDLGMLSQVELEDATIALGKAVTDKLVTAGRNDKNLNITKLALWSIGRLKEQHNSLKTQLGIRENETIVAPNITDEELEKSLQISIDNLGSIYYTKEEIEKARYYLKNNRGRLYRKLATANKALDVLNGKHVEPSEVKKLVDYLQYTLERENTMTKETEQLSDNRKNYARKLNSYLEERDFDLLKENYKTYAGIDPTFADSIATPSLGTDWNISLVRRVGMDYDLELAMSGRLDYEDDNY